MRLVLLILCAVLATAQDDHSQHQHAVAGLGTVDFPTSCNPAAQKLISRGAALTKMDDVFQQSRLRLIDLTAAKIRSQIDRIAKARADLEKVNANMLLGLRLLLTQEQWKGLQASAPEPRPRRLNEGSQGLAPTPKKVP